MVAQSNIIVDSSGSKSTKRYCRVTVEKYEVLSPMNKDKALSPIEKYKALSPINNDKTSLSVDKYEAPLPLNRDRTSFINSEIRINRRSAVIQSSLDDCSTEKNVTKPSSVLMRS